METAGWRVVARDMGDWVDRVTRNLFGFGRKSPPKRISGGGGGAGAAVVVAAGNGGENKVSQTVNDVKQINAIVDSKAVVVTDASIRSSLLFNDADGTACLANEAIFQDLALMGYEGDFNKLTFQKALFSPK
ncbi:hypothetical protein Tco_0009087 [Tanacetum coccineum]